MHQLQCETDIKYKIKMPTNYLGAKYIKVNNAQYSLNRNKLDKFK